MRLPGFSALTLSQISTAVLATLALYGGEAHAADVPSAGSVQASPRTYAFDLPEASLPATLDAIARLTGTTVRYDRSEAGPFKAAPVKGLLSAQDAVGAALGSSGFFVVAEGNALKVSSAQTVQVLALRPKAETSFKADFSDTATRSGTNMMDTPSSGTIITSDVLSSQQTTSLIDALRNVSGVGFQESPQGTPQFAVRGFTDSSQTVNGVSDRAATQTNVFGVDSIEVLKGPQAILAGGKSLAGGINIVMKKPTAEPILDLTLQAGTHMDLTIAGDAAGAVLKDDKRLTYRLVAAAAHADHGELNYNGREDYFVMPELRWKDTSTDVTFGVSAEKSRQPLPKNTFARGDLHRIVPVPKLQLGNPKDGFDVTERKAWYDLEYKFTPNISFISRVQYTGDDQYLHVWSPQGLRTVDGSDVPDGTVDLYPSNSKTHSNQFSGDHYIRMAFATGPLQHKLSIGIGHDNYNSRQTQGEGFPNVTNVSLYSPTPTSLPPASIAGFTTLADVAYSDERQLSAYMQDLVTWKDLSALVNFRREKFTASSLTRYVEFPPDYVSPKQNTYVTTPGVGLIYAVTRNASVYASISQGFTPSFGLQCGGGNLPPIRSRSKEVGAKFQFFDDTLSLTTAAFETSQSNSAFYQQKGDCSNPQPGQVTKGVELDLQGQLAKGWNAIFNYTYSHARQLDDPTILVPGVPRNKASLWTVYDLPVKALQGLGVGIGISASSAQEGSQFVNSEFRIAAQAQFDASLFYKQPKWHATLGVKNLANRTLYGLSTSPAYVPVLEGRTVMFTFVRNFE